MDRRTFFKIAGLGSLSAAAGCGTPEKTLYTLVGAPDDMVVGMGTWYASTCRECPAGCGIIVKNREGRAIKVEGNPFHPINRGKLCMRGQAALQGLYNPDRVKTPLLKKDGKWKKISHDEASQLIKEKAAEVRGRGNSRIALLSEVVGGPEYRVMADFQERMGADAPLLFEPLSYDALKSANRLTFGISGLPSYRMEAADLLLSFGADVVESWLSPVEYPAKYKAMNGLKEGRKGLFFHVSPFQSLTAANADKWMAVAPSSESAVAFGLIRAALSKGRGQKLPGDLRNAAAVLSSPFTRQRVLEDSGIDPALFDRLLDHLLKAEKPLILGTSAVAPSDALSVNVAANLLNMVLDPDLSLFDFENRHRVERAATRQEVLSLFESMGKEGGLLLMNNINPLYALPPGSGVEAAFKGEGLFTVSFSNFLDETAEAADLVVPVAHGLESWGEYGGKSSLVSTQQPIIKSLYGIPALADLLAEIGDLPRKDPEAGFRGVVYDHLVEGGRIESRRQWYQTIQAGGLFGLSATEKDGKKTAATSPLPGADTAGLLSLSAEGAGSQSAGGQGGKAVAAPGALTFIAVPSIRFFDGRGANRPWLCEYPDAINKVAWQTPVMLSPETLKRVGAGEGEVLRMEGPGGVVEAPAYAYHGLAPNVLAMAIGQGHDSFGRYAKGQGVNPVRLLPAETDPLSGSALYQAEGVRVTSAGKSLRLARTDGSKFHYDRKIVPHVTLSALTHDKEGHPPGLTMDDFPLTLPTREGYDPKRDTYEPHDHEGGYRWGMAVDLDRCIGCGACSVACYAENNIGTVGEQRVVEGREMSWLTVERYHEKEAMDRVTFLPLMCQHCDNAPCESVCPVYAPHHGKEGLNNQIYNRCIGTRYCSQNCPYKVRRFNWFDWKWPDPLNLQLNPEVTVRSKGVMEKCSFCVQRIKEAHGHAKNEKRRIKDGEITPACLQSCPTGALMAFGNLEDPDSAVRKVWDDPRAYQIMGYLNTKTAVIYLKKIVREI